MNHNFCCKKFLHLLLLMSILFFSLTLGACAPEVTAPPTPVAVTTINPTLLASLPTYTPIALATTTPQPTETPVLRLPRATVSFFGPTATHDWSGLAAGLDRQLAAKTIEAATLASKQALAQLLGIAVEQVAVVSTESVTWPDTCMGVYNAGLDCQQFAKPGYRILLSSNNQVYEYHTNTDGTPSPSVWTTISIIPEQKTARQQFSFHSSLVTTHFPLFPNAASIICCMRGTMLDGSGCKPSTNRALS